MLTYLPYFEHFLVGIFEYDELPAVQTVDIFGSKFKPNARCQIFGKGGRSLVTTPGWEPS